MVHSYTLLGYNIALDDGSGAVHVLDGLSFALLSVLTPPLSREMPEELCGRFPEYSENLLREAYGELYSLYRDGLLFSDDDFSAFAPKNAAADPIKAICLHVSHDCNMRCGYCFAGTGNYSGSRGLMSPETAIRAIDFVKEASRGRRNIEVDFFGGEPLMAFDTVVKTVEYARANEAAWDKRFRFTLTTNGLALDDKKLEFLNREMDNIVLSLDGRPEVNDGTRRDVRGGGTYLKILPKIQKAVAARGERAHYVRGTFTRKNLDFSRDVIHMADQGFSQISVEPVVTSDPEYALTEKDLPVIFAEYERLCALMLERAKNGRGFNFFHYMIDLDGGPCVIKRLRGCGAGTEYAAVTPAGEVYPCHQFVGEREFLMGTIFEPPSALNAGVREKFAVQNIYTRPGCGDCFARFYCSGGCSAANYRQNGDMNKNYELGCALEKKRVECAIALKVAMAELAEENSPDGAVRA